MIEKIFLYRKFGDEFLFLCCSRLNLETNQQLAIGGLIGQNGRVARHYFKDEIAAKLNAPEFRDKIGHNSINKNTITDIMRYFTQHITTEAKYNECFTGLVNYVMGNVCFIFYLNEMCKKPLKI